MTVRASIIALLVGLVSWSFVREPGCGDALLAAVGPSRLETRGGAIVHIESPSVPQAQSAIAKRIVALGVTPEIVGADIEAPGVDVDLLTRVLARNGRLELRLVEERSPALSALTGLGEAFTSEGPYVRATAGTDLRAAVADCAGCRLQPGARFDFGVVSNNDGTFDDAVYVTLDQGALDERHVAGTRLSSNDQNEIVVLVSFTDPGAIAFAELTGAHVGEYIAIVSDGVIASAPRVMNRIDGGTASISMNGRSQSAYAEARSLVASLVPGARLPEGTVVHVEAVAVTAETTRVIVELGLALVAALLAFGASLLLRRTALTHAPLALPPGEPHAWGPMLLRVLLTLALGTVPGLLRFLRPLGVPSLEAETDITLATFSLAPLVMAYFLVELVAIVAPSLNARRHAGPAGRAPLFMATALVALALYGLAAWPTAALLRAIASYDGDGSWTLALLSLFGGLVIQLGAARLVTRLGVMSGLAVLYVGDTIAGLVDWHPMVEPRDASLALLALATTVVLSRTVTPGDARSHRLPLGGGMALQIGVAAGLLLTLLSAAGFAITPLLPAPLTIVVAVVTSVVFALGVTRPTAPRTIAAALATTVVWVTAITLAALHDQQGLVLLGPLVGALALDVIYEARARLRHPDLVAVWSFHDVARADAAADDLRRRGLTVAFRGYHLQALLRIFGAWVPARLMVPADEVEAAQSALTSEPARLVVDAAIAAL